MIVICPLPDFRYRKWYRGQSFRAGNIAYPVPASRFGTGFPHASAARHALAGEAPASRDTVGPMASMWVFGVSGPDLKKVQPRPFLDVPSWAWQKAHCALGRLQLAAGVMFDHGGSQDAAQRICVHGQ